MTMTMTMTQTTFDVLPEELKLEIFSNLDLEQICKNSAVCRDWETLGKDNILWFEIYKQYGFDQHWDCDGYDDTSGWTIYYDTRDYKTELKFWIMRQKKIDAALEKDRLERQAYYEEADRNEPSDVDLRYAGYFGDDEYCEEWELAKMIEAEEDNRKQKKMQNELDDRELADRIHTSCDILAYDQYLDMDDEDDYDY